MKIVIKVKKEVEAKYLLVSAGVRYYEDATVNGIEDVEGSLIPCKVNDRWCPKINIDTGVIENWEKGKVANIHYKVCDDGNYKLLDVNENIIIDKDSYVPSCLSPKENGYGDYIIMDVSEEGVISNWKFDFKEFK
ncbi:hypothetical protein [Myroides odoratus]|uniref:Uncharacterized protein n=1 Tax=Myroides odoratus TaxID=256 RepID=A0A9Q6Z912_MYROD|nr:hypothetical protein [Myroides odoratus]EHQ41510.1 phage protein [Myroides odoratus DSM 2801]EKB02697.1 hypothetical protein HMPREF9716_03726 [Myroides odoratus CIP 103059]QQT98934.1 hypothetical protein I6I88_11990 [Myroides odoratus]WQD58880.1 hypothetical protein U0010_06985 [Myroides odoratus]STZ28773.1 Uncharacterised protein [Myroides odoratus]